MEQLDIFALETTRTTDNNDTEPKEKEEEKPSETEGKQEHQMETFDVKDMVEILRPGTDMDPEDCLYIAEFAGKKGTVVAMEEKSTPLAYWVDFGKSQGIFYASDMKFIR